MNDPRPYQPSYSKTGSLIDTFRAMDKKHLGRVAFNIASISWICMNVTLNADWLPVYMPCSYLSPNIVNLAGVAGLSFSVVVSVLAIKKGSLIMPMIALTFVWSAISTFVRESAR